jgi:hypothetical protein
MFSRIQVVQDQPFEDIISKPLLCTKLNLNYTQIYALNKIGCFQCEVFHEVFLILHTYYTTYFLSMMEQDMEY